MNFEPIARSIWKWSLIVGACGFAVWYIPGQFARNRARMELAEYDLKKLESATQPIALFNLQAALACKETNPELSYLAAEKTKATQKLRFLVIGDEPASKVIDEFLSWYDGFKSPCDPAAIWEPFSPPYDKAFTSLRKEVYGV